MDLERIPEAIEGLTVLDQPAEAATAAVRGAIPLGSRAKDLLSGSWLGHTLHPMLTDLPIGFWTSSFMLDVVGGRRARPASRQLVALGVLSALPTAAAGAADWSDTDGPARRVGLVHAVSNSVALTAYAASWLARRRGQHWKGVALGMAGATAASAGGHLGGHLVLRLGTGADLTAKGRNNGR